jgi:SAM-dependent methyltransferase
VNRHRQMAHVLLGDIALNSGAHFSSPSKAVQAVPNLQIYNAESYSPVHDALSKLGGYVCSEFMSPDIPSGQMVEGKLHQDLTRLSFKDNSFDHLLSGDVFEHIPDPYLAHREVFRVLKPGGSHVFTVPFSQMGYADEKRATIDSNGKIVHHSEPLYHYDPVRSDQGVLVYTIFAVEMLVRLKEIGFNTQMYNLYKPRFGILGNNSIVFSARKPA